MILDLLTVRWIPQDTKNGYGYMKKLAGYISTEANEFIYGILIYTTFQSNDSIYRILCHQKMVIILGMQDIGPGLLSKRKISITVQLSGQDEYEGGDLELFRGGSMDGPFIKAERSAGCVFLFPSYMMHRVTPVTRGTRKSFVLWLGGGHYK